MTASPMDFEADPELVFGEEFCFPATAYYPTPYAPAGTNLPAELYEPQAIWDQYLQYSGQQAEGSSCSYYVVPDYGITHSPIGPYPSEPSVIADGRFVGAQGYLASTTDSTYHQPVPTTPYDAHPFAAQWGPATTSQTLTYTDSLFIPSGQDQSIPVAPNKNITWNPSAQSTSVSSKKFQRNAMLPKVQLHSSDPWKQDPATRTMVPAKLRHIPQASRQYLQGGVPSVTSSPQTNPSCNSNASYDGSDLRKMAVAEKFKPSSKPRSCLYGSTRRLSCQNLGNGKTAIGSSEIVVKSYTSSLHIGDPEGKIIIRPDQFNRNDFQVVYPNAKFFVIKSWGEANVHKSVKYGVWSSSIQGNKKLDRAFGDAQLIAASSSTTCPVFLFFSVNQSNHFCGVAEMVGPVDFRKNMDFWSQDRWVGCFPVRWHIIKNIPNVALQYILLQNNEYRPVTFSRDTQEIHYGPGTSMLKIFKATRVNECLLDDFTVYEEEEARSIKCTTSKLRGDAPRFIPFPKLYGRGACVPRQPKADKVLVDRIIRESHNLADRLRHVNLDMHQGSWEKPGNLIRDCATTYAQKDIHCYGIQAPENVVKAVEFQPLASNMLAAFDGELTREKVQITPLGKEYPRTVAKVSPKAPEEYQTEDKITLVHSASAAPDTIYQEKKIIREQCSHPIKSQVSEACSRCSIDDVIRIGSMLLPMKMSS